MPADMSSKVRTHKADLVKLDPLGAWLSSRESDRSFPEEEEVFLVVFVGRDTLTHRCRIIKRTRGEVLVSRPSLTTREKSQMAPFTGRSDYRVETYYPAEIRIVLGEQMSEPRYCHLVDMSRGGMGLEVPMEQRYAPGQILDVRLVSWDYPVRLRAEVVRSWPVGEATRVALSFPEELPEVQRDLVTMFILDAQKREALRARVDGIALY